MEQLAIFIFGSISGAALLATVVLYIRHRRIVACKKRALINRTLENARLEHELEQAQIETRTLEKLVKDKLEEKKETDVKL
jgi:hypothetical protein